MVDLPDQSQQTVCELNCRIMHAPVGDASGQHGQGVPPLMVPFESPRLAVKATAPQVIVDGPYDEGEGWPSQPPPQESSSLPTRLAGAIKAAGAALSAAPLQALALLMGEEQQDAGDGEEALPPVAWHPRLKMLAAADGGGRVLVFDLDKPSAPPMVLVHELQRGVTALEWRPNSGGTLAVGCSMGVCLWKLGCGGVLGAGKAGSGGGWDAWMSFLRGPGGGAGGTGGAAAIMSVAWSPDGLLLAGASGASGLMGGGAVLVWDVALGAPACVRAGVSTIGLLRWSPCGNYLLAASTGASFYLWETHRWTCRRWSSAAGRVTSASWSPNGRVLVVSFSRGSGQQVAALHLACPVPSLDAHLLPLDLPGLEDGGEGVEGGGKVCLVESTAWDPTGERLAVAVRGGHPRLGGLVALYATRQAPVLSASLLGFMRAPPVPAAGQDEGAPGQRGRRVLRFHPKFPQGALLAERRAGGAVAFFPMVFSPS